MILLKVDFTQLTAKFSDPVFIHQRSITRVFKDQSIFAFYGWNVYTLNGVNGVTDHIYYKPFDILISCIKYGSTRAYFNVFFAMFYPYIFCLLLLTMLFLSQIWLIVYTSFFNKL